MKEFLLETLQKQKTELSVCTLCVCVRVCFYLSTLPTFPLLSSSVNPVMSQHVLLTETEMLQMFLSVAVTGSGKKPSHMWTYISEAARSPLPKCGLASEVNLKRDNKKQLLIQM